MTNGLAKNDYTQLLSRANGSFERDLVRFVMANHKNLEQSLAILEKIYLLRRASAGKSEVFCLEVQACYIDSLLIQLDSEKRDFFANTIKTTGSPHPRG